ncbi:BZIP domain-containing protein [Caerostris darwini]|uniref:BZIP domain-containing protein n=1 Tax=Caerostris darwini TaxID=1538125 RepID=A0AAV4R6P0_9ARAC|nr:BZIP domain-containing protein [Caerostris darwini]
MHAVDKIINPKQAICCRLKSKETFESKNSRCTDSTQVCMDLVANGNYIVGQNAVGITNLFTAQTNSGATEQWNLFSPITDISLNTFPVEDIQSQADKVSDFSVADDCFNTIHFPDSHLISSDLEELKFLDTYLEGSEAPNIDCQDINFNMELTEESFNLSSFIDFANLSSDIPTQELSYDFNSAPELIDLNFFSESVEDDQNSSSSQVSSLIGATSASSENIQLSSGMLPSLSLETNKTISKDDKSVLDGKKYRDMRQKNNIASQRSRKMRKLKEKELDKTLEKLEKENVELKLLHEKLEKERDTLQKYLMDVIAKK